MKFAPASRTQTKLRMLLEGPAKAGKTYTALKLATELAGGDKIVLIDTENASASKYADDFSFLVGVIEPPFHPQKFIDAITDAENENPAVIVLDSVSHAWAGSGGLLEIVDKAQEGGGNAWTKGWGKATPLQNAFMDKILHCKVHLICTARSKMEYVLEENKKGKLEPVKKGLKAVQKDDLPYEFDLLGTINAEHTMFITGRCKPLEGKVFSANETIACGNILNEWLNSGEPYIDPKEKIMGELESVLSDPQMFTDEQREKSKVWMKQATITQLEAALVKFQNADSELFK